MAKKEEIVASLKNLLETDTTRSKIGKIWEVFDEIVELQHAGVRMANIEARLNERGFDLKPGNLATYLYQIRKKKGIEKTITAKKEPKPKKTKTKPTASPVVLDDGKNRGDELDKPAAAANQRPPGLSNSAWSALQAKNAKFNRS
jgi:hypothetical protein